MPSVYDLKPKFQALLRPITNGLARAGVTANQVTIAAMLLSIATGAAIFYYRTPRILLLLPVILFVRMALNAINLFDQMAILAVVTTPYRDAFNIPDRQFFAGFNPVAIAAATPSIRPDPRYQMANNFQAPRVITLQARLTF